MDIYDPIGKALGLPPLEYEIPPLEPWQTIQISSGWNSGIPHTEETKKLISESNKGKIKTKQHRKNISDGIKNGKQKSFENIIAANKKRKGVPRKEAVKEKISKTLSGRKRPKEVGEKVSIALKGRPCTEERKAKIKETCRLKREQKLSSENS
jgi:hypothetical protein